MPITDFFKPVPTMSAQQLRELLRRRHPDEVTLVDVGQPAEFEKGHLPGARLIPAVELPGRLGELDSAKPTVVTCASGVRSRAAAAVLIEEGFAEVWSLAGGLRAWQGKTATGLPGATIAFFPPERPPAEHVALAWWLEGGSREFYLQVAELVQDRQAAALFRELTSAEEHHQASLRAIFEALTGKPAPADFPKGVVEFPQERMMEGGMELGEALAWAKNRPVPEILDLAIALETNAYDRYLLLHRTLPDENSQRAFEVLADEERHHLEKLVQLFEHFLLP